MKKQHSIISDHIYRGKNSGHINSVTRLIYAGKFFNDKTAIKKLIKLCAGDIMKNKFDAIIPIKPTYNKNNFTATISKGIAKELNIKYLDSLFQNNFKAKSDVKNLKILVFDDVIYSGKTMNKAIESLKKQNPKSIHFFAIAKSKSF